MRNAQLLRNLAKITCNSALILHHARAADYFQVCDLRKVGQDLVLHAVGKIGILFFLAQIVKRKQRDALWIRGTDLRFQTITPEPIAKATSTVTRTAVL